MLVWIVDRFSQHIAIPGNFVLASIKRAARIGKISLICKQNDLTSVKGLSKI
jgi:hypothetical protein